MAQWFNIVLGIVAGLLVVAGALAWAMWPRPRVGTSWFAPPTGKARDGVPDAFLSGDGSFGGDGHHGN